MVWSVRTLYQEKNVMCARTLCPDDMYTGSKYAYADLLWSLLWGVSKVNIFPNTIKSLFCAPWSYCFCFQLPLKWSLQKCLERCMLIMLHYVVEGFCNVEWSSSAILCFISGFSWEREAAEATGHQSDFSAARTSGRTHFNAPRARPCATRVGKLTAILFFFSIFFSWHLNTDRDLYSVFFQA